MSEPCHAEHTTGFTGKCLGRNEPGGAWEPCGGPAADLPQFRRCVRCSHIAGRHKPASADAWACIECPCPDYVDADPARWHGNPDLGGDPCCRHCGHGAGYVHPADSHCSVCFPNDGDHAMFALFQAACAVDGIEVPPHA